MKKIGIVFIVAMIVVSMVGCTVENRDYAIGLGNSALINETESITVLSVNKEETSIAVCVNLNFTTLKLKDFNEIYISKNIADSPKIELNIEKTKEQNSDEVFEKSFVGEITLYFENDMLENESLSDYLMEFVIVDEQGISKSYKFLLA